MGFTQAYAKANYLKVKEGKFWLNGEKQEYPFEGKIVGLSFKDNEYQGDVKRNLSVKFIDDQGETFILDINTESNNYRTLVSFLANKELIDLTLPVTLSPVLEDIKDSKFKRGSILVSQLKNGERVRAKGYFTKATPHGQPDWEVVKIGNKTILDKTKYLEFMEAFVMQELATRITPFAPEPKQDPKGTVVQPKAEASKEPAVDTTFPTANDAPLEAEVVEKMPWD
jgi:hypothetical protein